MQACFACLPVRWSCVCINFKMEYLFLMTRASRPSQLKIGTRGFSGNQWQMHGTDQIALQVLFGKQKSMRLATCTQHVS